MATLHDVHQGCSQGTQLAHTLSVKLHVSGQEA